MYSFLVYAAMIPVQFNPSNYSVTEGVDGNAVITLEALLGHPDFAFTVTVMTQDGSAIRKSCHHSYSAILFPRVCRIRNVLCM